MTASGQGGGGDAPNEEGGAPSSAAAEPAGQGASGEAAVEGAVAPPKKRGMLAAIAAAEAASAARVASRKAQAAEKLLRASQGQAEPAPLADEPPSTLPVVELPSTLPVVELAGAPADASPGEEATTSAPAPAAAPEVAALAESAAATPDSAPSSMALEGEASPLASASGAEPVAGVEAAASAAPASEVALAAAASSAPARPRRARDPIDEERLAAELRCGGAGRPFAKVGFALLSLGVAAAVVAGHFNRQRYVLECGADSILAKRGRSFPPWGESSLGGPQWKPVAIPPSAECRDRDASSEFELEGWYLELLVEQASLRLTARKVVDLDLAAGQLDQALLLARSPARREQRREAERLLGDVEYWRAVDKLRSASESLAEAARQFEEAALKQPKHVTDAKVRAQQLRRFLDELEGRISPPIGDNPPILLPSADDLPPALSASTSPPSTSPPSTSPLSPSTSPSTSPSGSPSEPAVAGQLEPSPPSSPSSAAEEGSPSDAGPSSGAPPAAAPPPPAANPSAGGVLL